MEKKTTTPAKAAAKSSGGGLNPVFVLPVILVVAFLIYYFLLGGKANFTNCETAFAFQSKEKHLNPNGALGIVYSGGIIVPILITFMITVLVFSIERFVTIGKASGAGNLDAFVRKVRTLLDQNNIADAIKECDKQKGSVGNVAKTALQKYAQLAGDTTMAKDQKLVALQKEVDEATTLELPMLEKNLTILSTLASVSTLVALLGTVIGMIRSFFALGSGGGAPDASALATGIAEALINTALGIGTSAIAIIMYNLFTSKIDALTYKIDEIGMSLQQNFAAHH